MRVTSSAPGMASWCVTILLDTSRFRERHDRNWLHGPRPPQITPSASNASRSASTKGWSCTPVCPLLQRRAGDHQAGSAKDFLLPVQRQVVSELRHHHMSQQYQYFCGLSEAALAISPAPSFSTTACRSPLSAVFASTHHPPS
jgi:hypothetical protein